jgi:hypothetical protein
MECLPERLSNFRGRGRISVSITFNLFESISKCFFVRCQFGNERPKTHNRSHWSEDPLYATNGCGEWFNQVYFHFGLEQSWFEAGVDSGINYSFGSKIFGSK